MRIAIVIVLFLTAAFDVCFAFDVHNSAQQSVFSDCAKDCSGQDPEPLGQDDHDHACGHCQAAQIVQANEKIPNFALKGGSTAYLFRLPTIYPKTLKRPPIFFAV